MDAEKINRRYSRAVSDNVAVNLYETVENNENFFIGRQWEGVQANGLPTPVFNFIKRVVSHLVASVVSDSLKIQASPMGTRDEGKTAQKRLESAAERINTELMRLFEVNKLNVKVREVLRNAAVHGDGCFYCFFDPDKWNDKGYRGEIAVEVTENTRVLFGNPCVREVERQPWIIIESREDVKTVRERAAEFGGDEENIKPDRREMHGSVPDDGEDMVTVLLHLERKRTDKGCAVMATECVKGAIVRPEWDTGLTRYPLAWLNWDYVRDSYHGQAVVSGLIPNQIFVNKLFAMAMISLMTTAYPKIAYDRTRVEKWDNRVGAAIPVTGDPTNIAKIFDPATISPQVSQFIDSAVGYTRDFMGVSDVSLGNVRPNNTSAIIAVQRASMVPLETTRQNLYQFLEDTALIFIDMMAAYYGRRDGYDFSELRSVHVRLKLDVGSSSYWSEISSVATLDNLLAAGKIEFIDYLERMPEGYIPGKQALIDKLSGINAQAEPLAASGLISGKD